MNISCKDFKNIFGWRNELGDIYHETVTFLVEVRNIPCNFEIGKLIVV